MITINTIIITLAFAAVSMIAFEYIITQARKLIAEKATESTTRKTINLFRLIFYPFLLITSLGALSINLIGLLVSAGFIGIVLGLACQAPLGNCIAGVYITIMHVIKENDDITISTVSSQFTLAGTIKHIGFSHTELETKEGIIKFIPNSILITSILEHNRGD